jgi:hypothetical protein
MKKPRHPLYVRHRFPAEVISLAVWLYFRFPLSLRMVEEMLGPAPLKALFARIAAPFATPDTPGAWYGGRRLVSLDGTTIDLPDTPNLAERFGRPAASRGKSGFPQLRLLTLAETGTHALFAVALDRFTTSEVGLAPPLLARLQPGMLCLADRDRGGQRASSRSAA